MKRTLSQPGFTLVELLIAVMVLAGAISGILLLYTMSMISSEQAWDTTVATTHGEHILEEMVARDSLESILATPWDQWTEDQHLNSLPQERIDVALAPVQADLLDVSVRVEWERKQRVQNVTLHTKIAK